MCSFLSVFRKCISLGKCVSVLFSSSWHCCGNLYFSVNFESPRISGFSLPIFVSPMRFFCEGDVLLFCKRGLSTLKRGREYAPCTLPLSSASKSKPPFGFNSKQNKRTKANTQTTAKTFLLTSIHSTFSKSGNSKNITQEQIKQAHKTSQICIATRHEAPKAERASAVSLPRRPLRSPPNTTAPQLQQWRRGTLPLVAGASMPSTRPWRLFEQIWR